MKETKTPLEKAVLYVVLTIIAFIAIFPLLYIILASFRTNIEIFEYALPFTWKTLIPQKWTVDNYVAIFTEMGYGTAMKNTLIVVAILVPLSMLISALGGFTFAFFDFKGKNILFAICLISFMIPEDAVALPLYNLISSLGMVNSYSALIFPGAASGLAMFLFTQFFKEIPKSLVEAARIDGASWIQVYFSYIFAGSAISAVVPVLLFLPLQKYFVQGITSSGVKG